jgi:hypothetical protein
MRGCWVSVLWLGVCSAWGWAEAPPVQLTKEEVIDRLCHSYERWRNLPGFEVHYRIDTEQALAPDSAVAWWPWGEFIQIMKPKEKAKTYVRWKHPYLPKFMKDKGLDPDTVCEDIGSCDGTMFIQIEEKPHKDGSRGRVATLTPLAFKANFVLGNNYYLQHLGFSSNLGLEEDVPERSRYPKGYWLPEGLRSQAGAYRLRPKCEQVDSVWCHVLEQPGADVLWLELRGQDSVALRRRRVHWPEQGPVREEITCADLVELAPGVWLPRQMRIVRYGPPWDKPAYRGRPVWVMRLRVFRMSAEAVNDEVFRPPIPQGTVVSSTLHLRSEEPGGRPITFVANPDQDPYEQAIGQSQQRKEGHWRGRLILWGLVVLVGVGLVVAWRLGSAWLRQRPAG